MATITTTVLLDNGQSNSTSFTVSATDMTRILNWGMQYYPVKDSNDNVITSPATIAASMHDEFWGSVFARVLTYYQQRAAATAASAVSPIVAT